MIRYNDDNIIVGYIKELLHSFNLPLVKYIDNKKDLINGMIYLYNDTIFRYKDASEVFLTTYNFNKKLELNLSKSLKINNLIYDSYTHNYLGEYLRFLRDYRKINLMPLYNCFSNELINNTDTEIDKVLHLNSMIPDYKLYAIPVKLNRKYTIAIDSNLPIEMACAFRQGDSIISSSNININTNFYNKTYDLVSSMQFNHPYVFTKLADYTIDTADSKECNLVLNEKNLVLLIKIPANNTSSIVILEGDYTNNLNMRFNFEDPVSLNNYTKSNGIPVCTKLQLLQYNSQVNHPFADKLVGYLLGNTVSNLDTIQDNFVRVYEGIKQANVGTWINNSKAVDVSHWNPIYNLYFIEQNNNPDNKNRTGLELDVLGYLDKDTERYIKDIDIYKDMPWTATKEGK